LTFTCHRHTTDEVVQAMDDATRFLRLGIRHGADTGRYHFLVEDDGTVQGEG